MGFLLNLFDLFNETAKRMAGYLPQSGADLLVILKKITVLAGNLDVWITNNIGINLKLVLTAVGKLAISWLLILFDLLRNLVSRL
ncbi:MAG: hypothetical protein AAB674_02235 [Patescibacteria group bacterium]